MKQASPFATYQIVHFTPTNLGGIWWSPLHSEHVPLAMGQGYTTFQWQHLQGGADIPEPSGPSEATETLELVEVCVESVQDRKLVKVTELRRGFAHSAQWEVFIQSAVLAEQRSLFKGLTCTSVSHMRKPCYGIQSPSVSLSMHTSRQRWDLLYQGSWDRTCLVNDDVMYFRQLVLCISASSPLSTQCLSQEETVTTCI